MFCTIYIIALLNSFPPNALTKWVEVFTPKCVNCTFHLLIFVYIKMGNQDNHFISDTIKFISKAIVSQSPQKRGRQERRCPSGSLALRNEFKGAARESGKR